MQPVDFEEVLEKIQRTDTRYQRDAYLFLREALDHTQKSVAKANKGEPRHVTGQELLEGIREYGLSQYGPMTQFVFNAWGLSRCEDWGEIVFNLIEHNLLRKTEHDRRADFAGGYDFGEAFAKPFLPTTRARRGAPEAKAS
jgi:uncharacterized repeat protein (TIGR04138 family)